MIIVVTGQCPVTFVVFTFLFSDRTVFCHYGVRSLSFIVKVAALTRYSKILRTL
jgi:hypothetical protein